MTDAERSMFRQFMLDNEYCWACGSFGDSFHEAIDYPRNLENHHIYGGAGRRHIRENLSRLCKLCHDLAEGHTIRHMGDELPNLKREHVLWLKQKHDPEWFDLEALAPLAIRRVPEPEEPAEWFLLRQRKTWKSRT